MERYLGGDNDSSSCSAYGMKCVQNNIRQIGASKNFSLPLQNEKCPHRLCLDVLHSKTE